MLNLRLEAEGGEQIWSFTKAVDKTRENRAFLGATPLAGWHGLERSPSKASTGAEPSPRVL